MKALIVTDPRFYTLQEYLKEFCQAMLTLNWNFFDSFQGGLTSIKVSL